MFDAAKQATAQAVQAWADYVSSAEDALHAAIVSHRALAEWEDGCAQLRLARNAAIRRALLDGWTYVEVANALDLSRQRVQQLAELPPRGTL